MADLADRFHRALLRGDLGKAYSKASAVHYTTAVRRMGREAARIRREPKLKPSMVRDWETLGDVYLELPDSYKRAFRAAMVLWYRFLDAEDGPVENIAERLPSPPKQRGRPRPLAMPDLVAIRTRALAEPKLKTRCMLLLGTDVGARGVEVRRLQRRDLDLDERLVTLIGKGGYRRTRDLSPALVAAFGRYLPTVPTTYRHVFPAENRGHHEHLPDDREISPRVYWQRMRTWFDRNGFDAVTFHRFRHSVGTSLQRISGDVRVTQEALGHQDVQTTEVYTAVDGERVSAAYRAYWETLDADSGRGPA